MEYVRHHVDGYSITHGVPEKVSHKGQDYGSHRKIAPKKNFKLIYPDQDKWCHTRCRLYRNGVKVDALIIDFDVKVYVTFSLPKSCQILGAKECADYCETVPEWT